MHQQPIPDPALAEAILGLLIDEHPGLWHIAELDRTLTPPNARPSASTEDAVAALYADGLVHRTGDFVFATRAAHACRALPG
jgi:hypothetical protein